MVEDNKKRIAIILPSFNVGGTENMVASLTQNLDKNKFSVLVISLMYPLETHVQKEIEESGVKVSYAMKGKVSSFKVFKNVYKELKRFKPDLIHSNMYAFLFAVPYLLTHKVKLLHTIHNKPINEFKNKYKKVISFLYRTNKAVPVAISHIVEREMYEEYPKLKHVERVYNPVDINKFYVERKEESKEDIVFIKVARFMKQKNHALLLDAFADAKKVLNNIHLWLVGDGELKEELKQQAIRCGISDSVHFIGNVSNVKDYLAKADVFVMSSDYEGLPLSVLEAMASGLPIISTNVGGLADIVTNNGILIYPQDREALSGAMVELAINHGKRYQLGQNSYNNAKQYDTSKFIVQYESLYEKYCK